MVARGDLPNCFTFKRCWPLWRFFLTDTVTDMCLDRPFSIDLEVLLSIEARELYKLFMLEDISSSSRQS